MNASRLLSTIIRAFPFFKIRHPKKFLRVLVSIGLSSIGNVVWAQSVGDFRSHQTGNWNNTATWEYWNGLSWITPAVTTPVYTDGVTTIRSNHVVTITAAVTSDQVVINAGGEVDVNAVTWTLNDGAGTDLEVYGILKKNEGSTISGGQRVHRAGSRYIHNFQTTAGAISTATHEPGSTVEIVGYTSNTSLPSNLNQPFGNFVWNCPNQTGAIPLSGNLTNVNGTLTIGSTGTDSVIFSDTTSPNATIGNLFQTNGTLVLVRSNGNPTINISTNFTQTGGTLSMSGITGLNTAGTGIATLKVAGNFSRTGGTLTEQSSSTGKGSVVFNGAGTQIFTSGGTVANTIDFTVNSGSSLMLRTNLLGNGSSGSFTLSAGATLGIGDTNGISLTNATGNIRVTGTRSFDTAANYTFNASAPQVTGDGMPLTVGNLTMDNSAGAPTGLTIVGHVTVNGDLYLKSGKLFRNTASCGIFGCQIILKGNLVADAGTELNGEIMGFLFAGTNQTITLSGTTANQDLGQMLVGTTTSNPTVTLLTDVSAYWGLTVGTATASTGTLNLNGKTLSVGGGNVTVNAGGTFLNTNGTFSVAGGFGPRTWIDNTGVQNFGDIAVNSSGTAMNLGSAITVRSVTINSGGMFGLGSYNLTVGGNWTNNGTFTAGTGTVTFTGSSRTVNGATTFNSLNVSGSYTAASNIGVAGNLNISGSLNTGARILTLDGNVTNSGSFISSGTVVYTGTRAQTLQFTAAPQFASTSTNIFTGTVAPTIISTTNLQFGTLTLSNSVAANTNWIILGNLEISTSNSVFAGGSFTHTLYGDFASIGSLTSSGTIHFNPQVAHTYWGFGFTNTGTVIFGGIGQISLTLGAVNYNTVVVTNTHSAGLTPLINWSLSGDMIIKPSATLHASARTFTISGNLQNDGTFSAENSTIIMSGAASKILGSDMSFSNLTVASTGILTVTNDFSVFGNFTNNGSFTGSGIAVTFNGSAASRIAGSSTTPFSSLIIAKTGGATNTLAANISNLSTLNITSGTLDGATFSISQSGSGGTLSVAAGAKFKTSASALPTFNTYSFDSTSTVEYSGSSSQTIAAQNYGNLTSSSTGGRTLASSGTIGIAGTFTPGANAYTITGSAVNFNGSGAQTIPPVQL